MDRRNPARSPQVRGRRLRLAVAAAAIAGAVAACSSGKHVDTTPLPTTTPAGALLCGFLDSASASTALGGAKFSTSGGVDYFFGTAQRNADGGLLQGATCQLYTKQDREAALSVSVQAIGVRPDVDAQVAALARDGIATYEDDAKAAYLFPADEGLGGAVYYSSEDRNLHTHRAGRADVLWGNWDVSVGVDLPGSGRDPVKDAVALTRQVTQQLKLPTARTLPLPS
jgi:hypothetical protein